MIGFMNGVTAVLNVELSLLPTTSAMLKEYTRRYFYSLPYRSDSTYCILFHTVWWSLCFSILYSTFHDIPSSSSVVVQHYCINVGPSFEFSSFNILGLPLSHSFCHLNVLACLNRGKTYSHLSSYSPLCIDIQSNPGPVSHVSSIIRSFANPLHYRPTANTQITQTETTVRSRATFTIS